MRTRMPVLLLWVVVAAGCRERAPEPGPEAEAEMKTIDRAELEPCLAEGGKLALVRVVGSEVLRAGTRSETARIEAELVTAIEGDLSGETGIRRYTSGGDPVLRAGRLYVVALSEVPRFAPDLALAGFVEVAEADAEAAVEAHRSLAEEIRGPR